MLFSPPVPAEEMAKNNNAARKKRPPSQRDASSAKPGVEVTVPARLRSAGLSDL